MANPDGPNYERLGSLGVPTIEYLVIGAAPWLPEPAYEPIDIA